MLVFVTPVLESVIPPAAMKQARGRGKTLSDTMPWTFESFERLRLEK